MIYESQAATFVLAGIATPNVAAIVIAVFGRDTIGPVLIVGFVPLFLASLVVWPYQQSERLPVAPRRKVPWNRRLLGLIAVMPLVVVMWLQSSEHRSIGGLLGALVPVISGIIGAAVFMEYRRRHPRDDA